MDAEFVTLTPENLAQETLCCIVRTRTKHPGVEAKRAWLAERLRRDMCSASCAERAAPSWNMPRWRPRGSLVLGENYLLSLLPLGAGRAEGAGLGPGS